MKKLLIFFFSIFYFSAYAQAEYLEYYDFQSPKKTKKQTQKEFVAPIETNTIKTHYEVNTDSMPKGIYKNNFVYSNGPFGALRPTHVPSFDTQHVQY